MPKYDRQGDDFMPRQTLTPRKDGRYRCKYKGKEFYGDTPTEALAKREHYTDMVKAGLKAETEGLTVREYSGRWLPTHKAGVKRQTYNAYASQLDRMNAVIGDKPIMHVTPSDIKAVYNAVIGMSYSTVHKLKTTVTALFESAQMDGLIRSNPCKEVKPHEAEAGTHRAITDEELNLILTVKHPFRLAVLTMRYAGLRRGEVLALDIDRDIDFRTDTIRVHEAVVFDGNRRTIDLPKTSAGIRTIPLFSRLKAELQGHHGLVAGKEYTQSGFARAWESYVNTVERHINGCQKRWYGRRRQDAEANPERVARVAELEFEAEKYGAFKKYDLQKQKQAEADKLRLTGWQSFTVRPHDLRHSFAQMLCDANVEIDLAIQWMGHSDERMIRRIYDHVSEYRRQKATADVEAMLADKDEKQGSF